MLFDRGAVDGESAAWSKVVHSVKRLQEPILLQVVPLSVQVDEAALRKQGFADYVSKPVLPAMVEARDPSTVDEEAERRLRALGYVD